MSSLPTPVRPPLPGEGQTRFGDYVLLDRVGSGGSGAVFRAWQLSLERLVAIKLLDPIIAPSTTPPAGTPLRALDTPVEGSDDDRFVREGRMAARLSHPNIVPIYEIGDCEGRRYISMKLISGQALARTALPARRAAGLIRQATSAIAYAHRNGVVHRDLKPHNLILEDDDHVWVTDFGIARSMNGGSTLTAAGSVMGTPAYMPPEQARGERCDERSDVYSLGATLYELLTGRPPFEATADLLVLMSRVLSGDPVPLRRLAPKVPAELETIVGKAMAKLPAQRYQSARELEEDLRRFLAGESILAKPPGRLRRAAKWVRRRPVAGLAVTFLIALGAGVLLHTYSLKRQLIETSVAEANALGAAGQWEAARTRYAEAARAFERLGLSGVGPELGLLDAYHHAPPPLLVLSGHRAAVHAVGFLPDGKHALSGSADGTLALWDVELGRQVMSLSGHTGAVLTIAVAIDGKTALSGGDDGQLRLWEIGSGKTLRSLEARGGPVLKVALSPDGRHALSRTKRGVVELWDLSTGKELRALEVAAKRFVAVAFSPDGRLALTGRNIERAGGGINTRGSLWEVATGREVQTYGGFGAEVESVAFSADGQRLLTAGYDRLASVWDVESGRRLLALREHRHALTGAAFSPKDRILVSAGRDNTVKLWDANDGKLIRSFDTGDTVEALAVSPDGNFILTAATDSTLKLWDLTVGQESRSFAGHEGGVISVALSPDGRLAVSGGNDRKVRLWDVATGREIRAFDHGGTVHNLAVTPNGKTIIAVGNHAIINAWDVASGAARPALGKQDSGAIRALAISEDGARVLIGAENGDIKLWQTADGRELRAFKVGDEVRSVAFARTGDQAVAASFDGNVHVLDLVGPRPPRMIRPSAPERIGAVDLSRDGRFVVTGNDAKMIRVWDFASGRELGTMSGHLGDVRAVSWSPDASLVLSVGRDRTMRVWDRQSGRELHAFTAATEALRSLAVSRDGRLALVGSEDGSMKLWDFSQVRAHRDFQDRIADARRVLVTRPGDGAALATLGQWYAFRGVCTWAIDLLQRAEAAGATVSPLELGRCHWRTGDLTAARRELQRAMARGESEASYLQLLIKDLGSADQSARLDQLSSKDGRVRFAYLGVRLRASPFGPGPIITRVFPHSPAHAAGLRVGDRLISADDQPIDSDAKLASQLASRLAGVPMSLGFMRAGEARVTRAVLAERPSELWRPDDTQVVDPRSGLTWQSLSPALAIALGLDPDTQGALVTDTGPSPPVGPAGKLRVGDVIAKVDGRPIATATQALAALGNLPLALWTRLEVIQPGPAR